MRDDYVSVKRRFAEFDVGLVKSADVSAEAALWSPKISMNAALRALPLILTLTALGVCQALTGGTRPVLSLPAYTLLAVAALLAGRVKVPRLENAKCLTATGVFFAYLLARAAFSPLPWGSWFWRGA